MSFANYLNANMPVLQERFPLIFSGVEYIIKQKRGEFGIRQGERTTEINLQISMGRDNWLEIFPDGSESNEPIPQPDPHAETYFFWGIGGGKQLLSTFYHTPFSQLVIVEPNLEMLAYVLILNDLRDLLSCPAVQIWVETRVDFAHKRLLEQKKRLFQQDVHYFETENTPFAKEYYKGLLQLVAFYQQSRELVVELREQTHQVTIGVAFAEVEMSQKIVEHFHDMGISAKVLAPEHFQSTPKMIAYLQEEKPEYVLFKGNELYLQDANLWAGEALQKLGIKVIKWYWTSALHPVNEWLGETLTNESLRKNEWVFLPYPEEVKYLRALGFQAFDLPLFAQSVYNVDLAEKETAHLLVSSQSSPLVFNEAAQPVYEKTFNYTICILKIRELYLSACLEGKNIFSAKADSATLSQYISGTYTHMNRQGRLPFAHFYQEYLKEWEIFERSIYRYWNFPGEMRFFMDVIKRDLFYAKWFKIAVFLKQALGEDFHLLNQDFFLLDPNNRDWPVEKVPQTAFPAIYRKAFAVLNYNNLAQGPFVDFTAFNAIASGAILFTNNKLDPFFEADEYILYDAEEDIPGIVMELKQNPQKAGALRDKAMHRLQHEHRLQHRLQQLLACLPLK